MKLLPLINDLERYVDESETISGHDKTVLHTKLLHLQIRYQEMTEKDDKEKADLRARLDKKTRDHKVSQDLLKLQKPASQKSTPAPFGVGVL